MLEAAAVGTSSSSLNFFLLFYFLFFLFLFVLFGFLLLFVIFIVPFYDFSSWCHGAVVITLIASSPLISNARLANHSATVSLSAATLTRIKLRVSNVFTVRYES